MKRKHLLSISSFYDSTLITMLFVILLAMSGCGSDSTNTLVAGGGQSGSGYDGGGQSGTGYVSGVVRALGSIDVNDIHFDTGNAQVFLNGQLVGTGEEVVHSRLAVGQVVRVQGAIGDDATGTADQVYYDKILEGPVESIEDLDPYTRQIKILGQKVIADDKTIWDGLDADELIVGMVLEVSGSVDNNNLIAASYMANRSSSTTYSVRGRVKDIDAVAKTFNINSLAVYYGDIADFMTDLKVEDIVTVQGTLRLDATFEADSLVFWDPIGTTGYDIEYAVVDGFVNNFISAEDLATDSYPVNTSSQTVFEELSVDELANGLKIKVAGVFRNGRIYADVVQLADNFARLAGNVLEVDHVDSTIRLAQEPDTLIRINPATMFTGKGSLDQIAPSDWVVVDGWIRPDGSISATQVKDDTYSGVIAYQDSYYQGYAIALAVGDYTHSDLAALGIHEDISSVKVARGYRIILYDQDNFSGSALVRSADDPTFVDEPISWNDRTKSLRVQYDTGAIIFENVAWTGYAVYLLPGDYTRSDLAALGINGDISSVMVGSGYSVTLYDQDNFGGAMLVRTSDEASLADVGWNDRVQSIRVAYHPKVVLYPGVNYEGYAIPLTIGDYSTSELMHFGVENDISSLEVAEGYKITLYDQDNFIGSTLIKTTNDSSLADDGWLGRVRSMVVQFNAGVVVYRDIYYWGYAIPLTVGDYTSADMAALGNIGTISSVAVVNGYKVTFYSQDYFTGESLVRTADDHTLVDDGWNDRALSIRVEID